MDSSVIAAFSAPVMSSGERGGRLELVYPPEASTIRVATVAALAAILPIHETPTAESPA
jgi:hypothetical protein